jgi:hypothetical protein
MGPQEPQKAPIHWLWSPLAAVAASLSHFTSSVFTSRQTLATRRHKPAGFALLWLQQLFYSAPGNLHPGTSLQDPHPAGTWRHKLASFAIPQALSTCYSEPGTCCHMCKWNPASMLCHFAGTRRLASLRCTEAQHSPPHLTMRELLPHLSGSGNTAPPLSENLPLWGHSHNAYPQKSSCSPIRIPATPLRGRKQ